MGKLDAVNNQPYSLAADGLLNLTNDSSWAMTLWQGVNELGVLCHEQSLLTDDPEPWWIEVADHIDQARAAVEQGVGK